MQKWEYLQVVVVWGKVCEVDGVEKYRTDKGPHISTCLKQWGEEGWEVCGVAGSDSRVDYTVFLKRPRP